MKSYTLNIEPGNSPTVTQVTPPSGPTTGGTEVTIIGSDLGDPDSARVDFGAGHPGTIISDTGSTIVATSPPVSSVGAVDVTVTVAGNTSLINRPSDVFTYFTPLSLSPSFLSNATATMPYATNITASGGTGAYAFALAPGSSLPPNLTLSIAGALRGTPTKAGNYSFTVTASDAAGDSGSLLYQLTVQPPPPLAIQTGSLHAAAEKTAFSQTLSASGGSGGGYAFTATGLPSWLHLSSSGVLSGTTPAKVKGQVHITVTVTDSSGDSAGATYPLKIDPPLKLGPKTVAAGTVGKPYSARLTASGGSGGGYTFTAASLPSWLKLSSAGILSGTPTTAGSFRISVIVTDSQDGTGTITETVKVKAAKRHGGARARMGP